MLRAIIRVKGHLDAGWADWLGEFTLTHAEGDETVLAGTVEDQAALYGLMSKLRDLGVSLVSVDIQDADQGDSQEQAASG